jgi:outer membrane protein OmpA-like peptidoglycan-associated protein/tetratricopeptide (TPR) repeat protein
LFFASCKTVPFQVKDGKTARELLLYNQSTEFLTKEFTTEKDIQKKQKLAFELGESYRKFNDYANAEKWYKQTLDLNASDQALFQLGMMQKQQEKYEEAFKTFELYQKNSMGGFEGRKQSNQCREAMEWKKSFSKIQIKNQETLNTVGLDYGLVPFKQNQFAFSSMRDDCTGNEHDGWTGQKFSDIFFAEKKDGKFSSPVGFGVPVNSAAHESSPTFSKDFKEIYFVRCKADQQKSNQFCHLYYSANNNEHWSEPVKVDLFSDTANIYDPYISRDGKTLFVSSDAYGGFGGTDIYMVQKTDTGWGVPQNLGSSINTPQSERSPWLDEKGNLFFSSNGLPGYGGLDIFKAVKTKAGFKDPTNQRVPINSGADDFAFWIDKYKPSNGDDTILYSGYFTSNRPGGKGGDDIYRFEEKWVNIFVLRGKVLEKNFENPENPESKILGLKNLPKAKIELRTSDDKVLNAATSDTAGNFAFKLAAETDYKIAVNKNGYFSNNAFVSTKGKRHQDSTIINLYVQIELEKIFTQKMMVIPNIYYDYDKATLRPESKLVLDSILVFFQENPDLTIEIGSHTDSRGSDAYNLKLSQARAQSVVDYLIEKGIAKEKLLAKGYGETKPVNGCVNGVNCTEEEHQKNRRTTFRVASAKFNTESIEPEDIRVDPKKD